MTKMIWIALICLSIKTVVAQQANTIRRLDGSRVNTDHLREQIQHILDKGKITGLQLAAINNNKIVWIHSFGLKDVANHQQLNDSTAMYGASFTKTVSAYLVLRLVDKGVLQLDRPVYQHLKKPIAAYDKWSDLAHDTAAFNTITLRMLLSHTSGMPILRSLYHDKLDLVAKPGEKFYYSNEGMNFLGFVIEEYTGTRLEVLAKQEIFGPLHMNHTSLVWEDAFVKNFSFAYLKNGEKYGSVRKADSRAAGSITTTAADYAKFIIALQTRQGLSPGLFKQMFTPQIQLNSRKGFGPERDSLSNEYRHMHLAWGLGNGEFSSKYGNAIFHTGRGDANQNYYVAYPAKGLALVMLSNSENFEASAAKILKICIGDVYSPLKWLGYGDN